jgi:hypothetical protein
MGNITNNDNEHKKERQEDAEKGIIKKRGKQTATCADGCKATLAMATASGGTRRRGSGLPYL